MKKTWIIKMVVIGAALAAWSCSSGSTNNPTCTPGAESCECKADGSCYTGLECRDKKCRKPAACTPGAQNCECKADGTCDTGLECRDKQCRQPAACTPGTEDCKCKTDGSCDNSLECKDNKCQQKSCPPGAMGCACKADKSCSTGLDCKNNTCVASKGSGLFVANADVRACDIVFTAKGVKVAFTNEVTGVIATKGEKIAVSFTINADKLPTGPIASMTDDQGQPLSGITPDTVKCYDRMGKTIAKPGVILR